MGLVAASIAVVASRAAGPADATESNQPAAVQSSPDRAIVAVPAPTSAATPLPTVDAAGVEYAVLSHELTGLPPDLPEGSRLDLWVAWDTDVARGPQIQRLVKNVILARTVAPSTPEGPVVVVLNVPEKAIGRLMYGDLYGSLSVSVPGGQTS